MTQDLILSNISKHIQLTGEEEKYFTGILHCTEINRKEILLKEGQVCRKFYYVHSGALRAYHIDHSGKESTIMFAVADWWITDMYCFLNSKPAMVNIEAIENSVVFEISKQKFDELFILFPKFEHWFRILMQNAYTREQLRIIENLSLTAEERYKNFVKKYPQLLEHITQKQIASYLGVTPEFLSSILKKK